MENDKETYLQRIWRGFCQSVVSVFYQRCEVSGREHLPVHGPVLLCANHANALADAVILQAAVPRIVHPLARSGLFKNWFLKPVLKLQQAVPVYRRQDDASDTSKNIDAFAQVYKMFQKGGLILIFPEGQSHSDPSLRNFKTGAARMVLGAIEHEVLPAIIPVGLNFSDKGKFRSHVLVKFGEAVSYDEFSAGQVEVDVRQLTKKIESALKELTINVSQHDDLDLIKRIERFFALRHGKYRARSAELRFKAMKKLTEGLDELRFQAPQALSRLRLHLRQYERLCNRWGVKDYHLTVQYRPGLITRFIFRSLLILFGLLPLAAWGFLNSLIPYVLTREVAHRVSKGVDQYDTAKMSFGLFFFLIFWGLQIVTVNYYLGNVWAVVYALSLPPTTAAAITLRKERKRIWENLRVFFLFVRKRKLRRYLEAHRKKLEHELAQLVRQVKRDKMSQL